MGQMPGSGRRRKSRTASSTHTTQRKSDARLIGMSSALIPHNVVVQDSRQHTRWLTSCASCDSERQAVAWIG